MYRPIFYELKKFPKLYLDPAGNIRDCPFEVPDVNKSKKKKQQEAQAEEDYPSVAEKRFTLF